MAEPNTLPATRPVRDVRVVENQVTGLYDTARFEHMQRIANVMALASLIPDHLKGKNQMREQAHNETVANCFILVNQADRWNVDPFSIAPETYVLKGKLGYSGKLVAAIVNTRAGVKENLKYTFTGDGDQREVTVHGTFEREKDERTITLKVKDAKTDNGMWIKDPDQKLIYSGATKWARRHCPEILLGVVTDDDLERIAAETATDVTPRPNRDDYVSAKPNGQIIEHTKHQEPQGRPTAEEATKQQAQAQTATDAFVAQQEQQSEGETGKPDEPAPWQIVDFESLELLYDDPADFANDYPKELHRALNHGGLDGLRGFIESNAGEVAAYSEKIDAKIGAALVAEGANLLKLKSGRQSGLDLDAPLKG